MKIKLKVAFLYSDLMNTYGDTGNVITLQKRAEWRGISVQVSSVSLKDHLKPRVYDLYFFGGGQDQAQELVAKDLAKKGKVLKEEIEREIPLLSICGGYQLLGHYYKPQNGPKLPGLGIFPAYTQAGNSRMIGNIIIQSEFGKLIGFENHSGKTFLETGSKPLGKVVKGFGNNGKDKTEGCIYKNAIGCYMHGSLLPKNPKLADWLIKRALEVKYKREIPLKPLDDNLENKAHDMAIQRFG